MKELLIVGIETSGKLCSVAWSRDEALLLEYNIERGNIHAELLAELVKKGFSELQLKPSDTDIIAVATGPGSFTGLRIGLSYAKGLCYGLQKPLVGVSNFEILAQAAPVAYEQLVTLIDARRGNWYLAVFSGDNSQIVNKVVVGGNELHQYISDDTVVVANTTVPEIKTRFILTKYSAGVLCKVGLHHYEMQGMDSIENLEPLYMQPFAGVI